MSSGEIGKPRTMKRKNVRGLALSAMPPAAVLDDPGPSREQQQAPSSIIRLNTPTGERSASENVVVETRLDFMPDELDVLQERAGTYAMNRISRHIITDVVIFQQMYETRDITSKARNSIQQELRVIRTCTSQFLVRYLAVFEDTTKHQLGICMEFMDVGSLNDIIKASSPLRVDLLGKVVETTVDALAYLYDKHRIIHRDIRPQSILVNSRGEIKLGNLGLSKQLMDSIAETVVGNDTILYLAPERIQSAIYTARSDTWSLGVTIMKLATGSLPWKGEGILDVLQDIVMGDTPTLPDEDCFPASLRELLRKCLQKDPVQRPKAGDLIDDAFLVVSRLTPVDMQSWAVSLPRIIKMKDKTMEKEFGHLNVNIKSDMEIAKVGSDPKIGPFLQNLSGLMSMEGAQGSPAATDNLCQECEKRLKSNDAISTSFELNDDGLRNLTSGSDDCALCLLLSGCIVGQEHVTLKLGQVNDTLSRVLKLGRGREDQTTGSDCAFQMAAMWLKNCATTHRNCNTPTETPLPTRVIDVGPPDGSQPPFLYHPQPEEEALYFTLSYRWGNSAAAEFDTTQARFESYKTIIPPEVLPQTMTDAIAITRRFGIQYLWIDALCIVQDSPTDWLEQAGQMASIYNNSALTIAASADRTDESQGCFRRRAPGRKRVRPVACSIAWASGAPRYVFADRRATGDGHRPRAGFDARGWVLQEQILSPRILYYAESELYWECISATASETFPDGIPGFYDDNLSALDRRLFKGMIRQPAPWRSVSTSSSSYVLWQRLVEDYSARKLTRGSDKLAAVLGLAERAAVVLGDRFTAAGVWESRVCHELLWWVKEPWAVGETRGSFAAPTWAWASVDGAVSFDLKDRTPVPDTTPIAEILKFEAEPADGSGNAGVLEGVNGSIVARGRLVPLSVDAQVELGLRLRLPEWREDFHGIPFAAVTCLLISMSARYVYALGLVKADDEGDEHEAMGTIYQRVGLACWSVDASALKQLGLNKTGKWDDGVELETVELR